MYLRKGLFLLSETPGSGPKAEKGDRLIYNLRIYLNRGEEAPLNALQARTVPKEYQRQCEDGVLIDHHVELGKRHPIAAVEYALYGMRQGGFRLLRASPHLAYGEKGLPDLIPKNAVLTLHLWLRKLEKPAHSN